MKILNLYAGLGGNRKSWTNHEIKAVEIVPEIAEIYRKLFPGDQVIIADVMQFVRKENLGSYDFIWASPPCKTHSCATTKKFRYVPDLTSIHGLRIFLDYQCETPYVIENVQPFYKLPKEYQPTFKIDRHLFWANFFVPVPEKSLINSRISDLPHKRDRSLYMRGSIEELASFHNYDLSIIENLSNRESLLRNMTHWKIGKYILDCFMKQKNLLFYFKVQD